MVRFNSFPQVPRFPRVSLKLADRAIGRFTSAYTPRAERAGLIVTLLAVLLLCSCGLPTTPVAGRPDSVKALGTPAHQTYTSGADSPCTGSGCGTPPLYNTHHGPVVHDPKVYLVFWGPWWQSAAGTQSVIAPRIEDLFLELAGGQYHNILSRYTDNQNAPNNYVHNDVTYVTAWTDAVTPIGSQLTMNAIGNEALKAVLVNNWPRNSSTLNTLVLVFPQPGTTYDSSLDSSELPCLWEAFLDTRRHRSSRYLRDGSLHARPATV